MTLFDLTVTRRGFLGGLVVLAARPPRKPRRTPLLPSRSLLPSRTLYPQG